MKKSFAVALLLASCFQVFSQKPVRVTRPETVLIQKKQVVLFDNINFSGVSKAYGPGEYLLSNFNDQAASIRVPDGMVAYLYEHASQGKGYGISVDLLEDVADLGTLQFSKKLSYLVVFTSTRENTFVWARNAMVNGQFVPGHWERKKANPGPPNTIAVVSPPIEAPLPTTPSVLTVNGPNTNIQQLGIQTTEGRSLWERAMNTQLGIIGNDFRGIEELGSACFQRASNNLLIPDNLNFWYLQKNQRDHRNVKYFKRTLTGEITRVHQVHIEGTFEDFDANIDIKPDPSFLSLLTDAHGPEYTALMKTQYYGSFTTSGESGCPSGSFTTLEAEIADKYRPADGYKSKLIELNEDRVGKKIAVYGPWIWDEGHCCHPEIHPAEQLWWNETNNNEKVHNLNVVCDASRRFFWRNQMDDGTKLKPWAEPPIKGLFAIAFEYSIPAVAMEATAGHTTKTFEVNNIQHHNVIEYPAADQVYNLTYNGKNIISFIPHNNAFKVSFEQVGISPADRNKIRGFLVIETSVGVTTQKETSAIYPLSNPPTRVNLPANADPSAAPQIMESIFFSKEAGLYYFKLIEKNITTGRPDIRMSGN
ncbi:MAG TPA: hypothetical protein PLO99_07730 [Chitinophagaceae bacterium]|nr:hypothetical protein [Chitinophagaceae bacterium]